MDPYLTSNPTKKYAGMIKMTGSKFIGAKFVHVPTDKRDSPILKKDLIHRRKKKNRQKTPD